MTKTYAQYEAAFNAAEEKIYEAIMYLNRARRDLGELHARFHILTDAAAEHGDVIMPPESVDYWRDKILELCGVVNWLAGQAADSATNAVYDLDMTSIPNP